MASKRIVTRRGSDKRRYGKVALELSRDAKSEVAELLKRYRDGTITRVELNTGFKEVDTQLKRIMHLIHKIL